MLPPPMPIEINKNLKIDNVCLYLEEIYLGKIIWWNNRIKKSK